ncbi:unnamed protein product, partial [Brassica napus]
CSLGEHRSSEKMKLFDAHCHLQDPRIISKAPHLISSAVASGVSAFAVNGVSEKDWNLVKEMGVKYPSVVPCFGIHPWYVAERSPQWFETLKSLFETTPTAAIGEIGLDKGSKGREIDFSDQVGVFRQQLELAKELNKPASIHCVRAFGDLLEITKSVGPFPAGLILHSYLGSAEMVPEFAKLGAYFSFSGFLMSMSEKKAKKMLKAVPSDRILLETDSPDALPKSESGTLYFVEGDPSLLPEEGNSSQDLESNASSSGGSMKLPKETLNHPANIHTVLGYVARLLDMKNEELAELSYINAVRLFSYSGSLSLGAADVSGHTQNHSTTHVPSKKMSDLETRKSKSELHLHVKDVPFHLCKETIAKRSAIVSSLLERNKIDELPCILQDIEADPETFKLVAKFCYGYKVNLTSDNIISVLCIAYYLGMKEEHSTDNLLGKASSFLETRVLPSWNETVNALRSGEKSLDKLADFELVDLFFDSLIEKASYDPRLLGEPIKNREETTSEYRPNPRRRLFDNDWKSEDLITLPLRFYEPLMIRAMESRSIPVEYIVTSICKYAKKWVLDAEDSVSGKKREVVEAVERLLPHKRGLISCEFLFKTLKHSISLEASSECRNGFGIRVSKQLDMAKPTDLKILTQGYGEKDIQLLRTVVTSFYSNYTNEEEDSEDVSLFVKVAKLLEEFLLLAVSEDASLKLEAFVALGEITAAISLGVLRYSDGIYRAVDVFLERHGYLTESEKMEACKVLDCKKLSRQGCEEAAKNQRLPLRVVVQVFFASQLQIRDTVAKEIKGGEEIGVWSDEDEIEKMTEKLLGMEIEDHECVVHRWKKAKKVSVWRQVKRKFGCLNATSSSSADACTCDVKKKKKKKIHHHYK